MDLSSQPYRILKCHPNVVTNVAFHRSYPLFASCSDDGTTYIFHGMVYSGLHQNPLTVPLKILCGHANTTGRGVMDCKFHPRQPWLFTAGVDFIIKQQATTSKRLLLNFRGQISARTRCAGLQVPSEASLVFTVGADSIIKLSCH